MKLLTIETKRENDRSRKSGALNLHNDTNSRLIDVFIIYRNMELIVEDDLQHAVY
jgi:hypothetical protein